MTKTTNVPTELLEFICGTNNNALSRLPELRALLATQPQAKCATCGEPTMCGKIFCEDHCYEQPQASAAQAAPDERVIPTPTALILWANEPDEGGDCDWNHGYEAARGYVKIQIDSAVATAKRQAAPVVPADKLVEGLDEITALSRHLRQGGCDSTDLPGLEEGLTHAIDMASEMLSMLSAAPHPAPQPDQADEVREALERARYAVERGEYATGCCCCGNSVASHGLGDGHSPVDEGDYFKLNVLKDIDAALTQSTKGEEE